MLINNNEVSLIADNSLKVATSIIKIVQFSAFDLDHTLTIQPFVFTDLSKYTNDVWRKNKLDVNEVEKTYKIPYEIAGEEWDKLQTMWYVYEQLRLNLLLSNPTWDGTKLINVVPHFVTQ